MFTPTDAASSSDGALDPKIVWAALDCPSLSLAGCALPSAKGETLARARAVWITIAE